MITIEELKALGADTDTGLSRCLGNEALYLKLVGMGLGDAKFEELGAAVNDGDLDKAFELCHALKGVIGNLAISPLYEALSDMTEKLRGRQQADYKALYSNIIGIRSKIWKA
jgi:hypothetical protein